MQGEPWEPSNTYHGRGFFSLYSLEGLLVPQAPRFPSPTTTTVLDCRANGEVVLLAGLTVSNLIRLSGSSIER